MFSSIQPLVAENKINNKRYLNKFRESHYFERFDYANIIAFIHFPFDRFSVRQISDVQFLSIKDQI